MYGAASTRARVIPRSISITIIVAGLMSGVPIGIVYLSGGVVQGLAFVWLGEYAESSNRRSGVGGCSGEMSASTAPTAWLARRRGSPPSLSLAGRLVLNLGNESSVRVRSLACLSCWTSQVDL